MSGRGITLRIAAGYSRAGQRAGSGIGAPRVTIVRHGPRTGPSYAPTHGDPIRQTFTALPVTIESAQRAGLTVEAKQVVYSLVNEGAPVVPSVGDVLQVDGNSLSVVDVIADDPAGHVLTWMVKAQR